MILQSMVAHGGSYNEDMIFRLALSFRAPRGNREKAYEHYFFDDKKTLKSLVVFGERSLEHNDYVACAYAMLLGAHLLTIRGEKIEDDTILTLLKNSGALNKIKTVSSMGSSIDDIYSSFYAGKPSAKRMIFRTIRINDDDDFSVSQSFSTKSKVDMNSFCYPRVWGSEMESCIYSKELSRFCSSRYFNPNHFKLMFKDINYLDEGFIYSLGFNLFDYENEAMLGNKNEEVAFNYIFKEALKSSKDIVLALLRAINEDIVDVYEYNNKICYRIKSGYEHYEKTLSLSKDKYALNAVIRYIPLFVSIMKNGGVRIFDFKDFETLSAKALLKILKVVNSTLNEKGQFIFFTDKEAAFNLEILHPASVYMLTKPMLFPYGDFRVKEVNLRAEKNMNKKKKTEITKKFKEGTYNAN
jgi:hypothetical protein